MKKLPISLLCGLVAVLVTIILYFTVLGNAFSQLICFITLVGVIIAELAVTALAYLSNGEPRKIAATVVSAFMIPIAVFLSIVYITNFPKGYGSYIGYYLAAFVVIIAIVAVIWKFSDNKETENKAFQDAKANMLNLRKLVKCIIADPMAENYKAQLEEIEEKLHFSNDAVIMENDKEIMDMIIALHNNIGTEGYDVEAKLELLAKAIDRRNIFANKNV